MEVLRFAQAQAVLRYAQEVKPARWLDDSFGSWQPIGKSPF